MAGLESLLTGRTLAERYRIEEVIGRGGMAAVYRAADERLGRRVAVKVVMVATDDADSSVRARARFQREARAAAGIDHPNVITVHDFGTDADTGLDYLVMELLHGEDLAARLAHASPIPLLSAVTLLRDAALGLAAGHRLGLVHRDVKPGNLFLARVPASDSPRVVVLDFGIAQISAVDGTLTHLTGDGRAPLSPGYASPEQIRGAGELTPASDVFSLGAIGYQLLTGERLFEGPRGGRRTADEPFRVPTLRSRNPLVPPRIEEIVRCALDPDPLERFADAGAFAEALNTASRTLVSDTMSRSTRVVAAPGTTRTPRTTGRTSPASTPAPPPLPAPTPDPAAPRPVRSAPPAARMPKLPRWAAPAAAVLVLLIAATAGALWMLPSGAGADPRPEVADASQDREAAVGDTTNAEPVSIVATAPTVPTPPIEEVSALAIDPPAPGPAETPAAQPPAAEPPAAERPAPEASPARATPAGGRSAGQLNAEGVRLLQSGDAAAASERLRQAVEREPRNPEFRNNYGWALFRAGQLAAAERELRQVLEIAPRREIAYANLGEVRAARGDTATAIAMYERFLELNRDPRRRPIAEQKIRELRRGAP